MSQSVSDLHGRTIGNSHDLARACRTARVVGAYTQEDVAELAGITQPELSRFERCERPKLTFDQGADIVTALGYRLVLVAQDAVLDLTVAAAAS
jgi:hypothetical protein